MNTEYLILFLICLICHLFRSLYEILKYKNKVSPANKIVFAFVFINMCLLWMSWFMMSEVDPIKFVIPFWLRITGLVLFIIGVFLFIYTVVKLKTLDDYKGELVQDGLFSIIRHPMYLALLLTTLPLIVTKFSMVRLLLWLILLVDLLLKINFEEELLTVRVAGYANYAKDSYRLIPFVY